MKKRAFVSKKIRKLSEGECKICGENNYTLLDVHRIVPGSAYAFNGIIILCVTCHRLVHDDQIKILGWVNSTAGRLIHIIDKDKKEQFL